MLKYLPLLWANLRRKRLRTGLTLASIVVAFLLFGLMQTLRVALTGNPELAGVDRLVTIHKIAIIQPLPESYLNRIRAVPGKRPRSAPVSVRSARICGSCLARAGRFSSNAERVD